MQVNGESEIFAGQKYDEFLLTSIRIFHRNSLECLPLSKEMFDFEPLAQIVLRFVIEEVDTWNASSRNWLIGRCRIRHTFWWTKILIVAIDANLNWLSLMAFFEKKRRKIYCFRKKKSRRYLQTVSHIDRVTKMSERWLWVIKSFI